ncbi:tetratricopeptide repeat protein [Petrachloros mirabilis]|nr:tetratricopeptide repeat protein [Nitrospira sp.]
MWSHLILACTILLVMSSCGGSKSVPAAEDQQAQAVKQGGLTASPAHPLRTQAEKGNVEAQFALAQAYDRGRDLPQDKTEAVRWYQLAAKQGDAFSQFYLGNKYWEGAGVSKNEKEAVRWWYSAAAQGFAPAQNSLGLALATGGKGVPQDMIQAYLWLTLSAGQGDQEAEQQRTELSKQLKPAQLTKAKRLIKEWKPTRPRIFVNRSSP